MSTSPGPDNLPEEFALGELVRESGDPRVERSAAQIASVEQAILTMLRPQMPLKQRRSRLSWQTGAGRVAALAAGILLAVWLGRIWTDDGVSQAWAEVAEAINAKPWVHGVWRGPEDHAIDIWFSPAQKTSAERITGGFASFSDFRDNVLREYNPDEKVITLRPIGQIESADFRLLAEIFELIFQQRDPAQVKRAEIIEQTRRELKEGDKKWSEFDFLLRKDWGTVRFVFRVDPLTHLPQSLSFTSTKRSTAASPKEPPRERRFVLDYPATGPADIYALGVPKETKIIDCGSSADVQKLVQQTEDGRVRFEHYVAIVVPNFSDDRVTQPWWQAWSWFYRVYRKGDRWRVEQCMCLPPESTEEQRRTGGPGNDIDRTQWWIAEARKRPLFPLEACDGKALYHYDYDFSQGTKNEQGDFEFVAKAAPVAQPVSANADEKWSYLMPDLEGRPSLRGLVGSPHYSVRLDVNPTTGPPGTVLLEAQTLTGPSIHGRHPPAGSHRYWIDPSRNYLAMRWETSSLKEGRETLDQAAQIEKTALAPQGRPYSLDVRVENIASPGGQTFHFYVDFAAEIPDSVFDPKSE